MNFVAITKMDVALNSLLVRSKYFGLLVHMIFTSQHIDRFHFKLPTLLLHLGYQSTGLRSVKASTTAPSVAGSEKPEKTEPKNALPARQRPKASLSSKFPIGVL